MPKFSLGRLVATPGALSELERVGVSPEELISRHGQLDQGALDAHDHKLNIDAVERCDRVFSSFVYGGVKFWVITEWNRGRTTIMLPEDC